MSPVRALQRLKARVWVYGGSGWMLSPVWARNPSMRAGRYWIRLSRFFMMATASWRGVLQAITILESKFEDRRRTGSTLRTGRFRRRCRAADGSPVTLIAQDERQCPVGGLRRIQ